MNNFLDLADLQREQVIELLALAERLAQKPEPQALAGKILGLLFFNPSLRTLASMQAAMARLGGNSFVISAGQGTWQLETRRGAVMNGAPAEHVREGVPVLAHYCDALGIRAFAGGADLEADLDETSFKEMVGLVNKPVINMESAANHPCQALADWKTLDDLAVPRKAQFVSVVGEPSARAAARGAGRHRAHGRDARHGSRGAAARRFRAAPGHHAEGRRWPRPPRAARCARPTTATTP